MSKHKSLALFLTLLLVVALSATGLAQFSGRTVGLGDEFVTVTGSDAVYGNPAAVNLTPDIFTLELSQGVGFWNNLLMNDYIDESEKADLIDRELLAGIEGRQGTKLILGPVALVSDMRESALVQLPPDLVELLLEGNEIDQTYDFAGTEGSGAVYGDAGINFSIQPAEDIVDDWGFENVYMGFTYHQLAGAIFAVEGSGQTTITYDENGEPTTTGNGEYTVNYNEENIAMGSALDLGLYADLSDKLSVGLSALNIGSLQVDGYQSETYVYDTEKDVDKTEVIDVEDTLQWNLPATIRAGAKIEVINDLVVFADYSHITYNNGQIDQKVATAAELTKLGFIPLRTGLNYSTLAEELKWSAGLGLYLGPIKADVGISNLLGLNNQSKSSEVAMTTKIEF